MATLDEFNSDSADDPVAQLARLGGPVAEFAVSGLSIVRTVLAGVGLAVCGLGLVVLCLIPPVIHLNSHGLLWGVFLFLMGVMLLVRAIRNRRLRVRVFAEGLVRIQGHDAQAFLWEDVLKVWRKRAQGHWNRIRDGALQIEVETRGATKVSFDDSLPDLKRLGELLDRYTLPHLLAAAREALDRGEVLHFGRLRLSQVG